ncbi:type I polyketide synthase [Streptomyces sp. YGL11-2]|uniref:type I polyketide synthase n=1 Tax=Streptomyces sp. YGL11-2 TaxID=3414028 RepID=UPI003CEBDC2D
MSDFDRSADDEGFLAVIGMSGRFPGAASLDEFWSNLVNGLDTITREPAQIFPGGGTDGADQSYVPARGRLDAPEWFDADYFGYSAKEAFLIDPQHRIFLECSVAALEDAGADPDRFRGAIGVYGGSTETYYAQTLLAQRERLAGVTEDEILLGTAPDFLASRTAERLGLRGPAIAVQSACATALVALHTAGRGLLAGDCDMALAGGVAVHVPPKKITWTGPDGTLAPDGTCRAFDARGEGTVASNGVGVVVLKRLSDALADGDPIRAVLRGSAVTNDGSARIGFTAPSVEGQAAAVREAQLAAGTDARTITYVEAHGTATPLGDPIEVAALTDAFRSDTGEKGFCWIGSVKTNIGHADAAAGAAGFLKTVLALEHGKIPPSLHHTAANPQIDFESSPFRVVTRLRDWEPYGTTRRAGVSSFAVGGVNAHLVLEEAPARPAHESVRRAQLFVHSARTATALRARVRQVAAHLRANPELPSADVAWTLQTGRREHEHRAFTVVSGRRARALDLDGGGDVRLTVSGEPPRKRPVVFLFPGKVGPAEAWQLRASEPAFHKAFDACLEGIDPGLARDVREVARGIAWPRDPAVRDTYAFALEYSLAMLWQRWGVEPDAVFGTGVGSLVAAVVAGAISLPDALRLVTAFPAGTEPGNSGPTTLLDGISPRPLRVPVVLGDGAWHGAGSTIGADQWANEFRGQEVPDDALSTLLADADRILLQIGAGSTLVSLARKQPAHTPAHLLLSGLPDVESAGDDVLSVLYTALGRLWLSGAPISWEGVHDGERRTRTPLPTYPFERLPYLMRHPAEAAEEAARATGPQPAPTPDRTPQPADGTVPDGPPAKPQDSEEPAVTDQPADDTPLALVLRLFGEALGLSDIEPDESFFELGGDSLIAAKLLVKIRSVYPVEIKMRSLFSAATAADLAELIEQRLADPDHGRSTDEESS